MQSRRLLPFANRTIATLTANYKPIIISQLFSSRSVPFQDINNHANLSIISYNKSINNLIKSNSLNSAIKLFDEMPQRDVITWNIIISGHNFYGFSQKSLYLYTQMVSQGIKENCSTFSSVISVCSNAGFYKEGLQVHCRVIVLGFSCNAYIGSAVVDLYIKMGLFDVALGLFNDLQERNLATWNLVFRGLCEMSRSNEMKESLGTTMKLSLDLSYENNLLQNCKLTRHTIHPEMDSILPQTLNVAGASYSWLPLSRSCDMLILFREMRLEGVEPNGLSFCYLIRGCGNERLLDGGKQFHCCVMKKGWLESNLFVANALVDFYSAFESVIDAKRSFEVIPPEDVISWNSMVFAYAASDLLFDALEVFKNMQFWGKKPSARSLLGFLNLSSRAKDIAFGKQIHCCVLKLGFDSESVLIQSGLIDMYGKCGDIESSVCIFQSAPERTLECCNSLITSLLHCSVIEDVIELFGLMVDENIGFDEVSLSSTLKAMSISPSASLASCKLLHCSAVKTGFEADIAVSCSLIDAYSRSGQIKLSRQVFDNLQSPNVICFTSIINAYAYNGMGLESLGMLNVMIKKGIKADKVTFLCVLMGCNHSGLVQEGRSVFNSMSKIHGIYPDRQHISCMVDLLGRAGLVDDAEVLLKDPPARDDPVAWSSLLRSCRIHRNEEVGRRVAEKLMGLEPEDPTIWLQISRFCSEMGDFATSAHIQEVAVARKMRKDIGYSLIEVYDSF